MNFEELGLAPEILKAIGELGFESPTPVQEKCIPFIKTNSQDLIANAQTGTGKTAAFGLPILEKINHKDLTVQTLILSPTRELAVQIANDLKNYSKYSKGINVIAVYGGASMDIQVNDLRRGGQIVVGNPGRVMDLIKRNKLKVGNIKYLVLDEADEMLSMGFKDELDAILSNTPADRQTLLFSATMPSGVEHISKNYMNNPEKISLGKRNSGADNVHHIYYKVAAKDRYLALKRIVDINPGVYGIVFVRTRRDAKEVAEHLMKDGYNADALHGDLSQPQREYVMSRFRSRNLQLLVATDVAARGLDVDDLTHILNYNIPDDVEVYVHRSGRTGRAGKSGISISIIHGREQSKVKLLEKMVGKKFQHQLIPVGKEVCEKQLFHLIDVMEKVEVDEKQINPFLGDILQKLESLSREELIKRFVSVEFNRFLNYYTDAEDINLNVGSKRDDRGSDRDRGERGTRDKRERRDSRDRREGRDGREGRDSREGREVRENEPKRHKKNMDYSRFYINLGTKNGINPGKIIGLLTQNPEFKSIEIGEIELFNKFSFFEVDKSYEGKVFDHLDNLDFQGVPVRVELTKAKATPTESKRVRQGGGRDQNRSKSRFGKFNDKKGPKSRHRKK